MKTIFAAVIAFTMVGAALLRPAQSQPPRHRAPEMIHSAQKWEERTVAAATTWQPDGEISSVLVPLDHTRRTVWAKVGPAYLNASPADNSWYSFAELQFWKNGELVGQSMLTSGNIGRISSTVGPSTPLLITSDYLVFYPGVAPAQLGPVVPAQRFNIACDKISLVLKVAENRDPVNGMQFLYGLRVQSEIEP